MRVVMLVVCMLAVEAHAQAPSEAKAHSIYLEGTWAYEAGRYLDAAARFEQAYALQSDPAYLFNIGQAYRSGGRCAKAADAYRKYIEVSPNAPNLIVVRAHLREVNGCVLFEEGRVLVGRGQHAEACVKFDAAHREDPLATGTLMNLGLCHEKTGKPATARMWFRRAMRRAKETMSTEAQAVAQRHVEALDASVPTLTVVTRAARVTVDGKPVSAADRIELDPGTHVVEAGTMKREVTLRAGQHETLELMGLTSYARDTRRIRLLTIAGSSLVASSVVLGFVGRNRYTNATSRDDARTWRSIVRYGGTSLFALGATALAGAGVIYLRRDDDERPILTPVGSSDHLGLAITGGF